MNETIHVIGAGISGLGTAHLLQRQGEKAVVHEATKALGGRAGYTEWEGECLEYGGKNYASNWRIFNDFIYEFGLGERDEQHPNFHIILNDKLIRLEKKQSLSSAFGLVKAIGVASSIEFQHLLSVAKRHATSINYTGGLIEEFERKYDDRPISELFHHNLAYGPLRMFSIIMGAAEPEEMYLSQIIQFLSSFGKGSHHSVTGGIAKFFDALAADKEIRFSQSLDRIEVENNRVKALHFATGTKSRQEKASKVISTLPLHVLLKVLDLPDDVRRQAERIRYYPLALVNAVYDQDVFTPAMNSIMFGPGSILGHCSANRMYQKNRVRFTLSGRAARSVLEYGDEALVSLCEQEFRRFHPIDGKRIHYHVQRHMGGICAYAPRFTEVKRTLLDHISDIEGLEIAGDYLEGHNMEGCLMSAEKAVAQMTRTAPVPKVAE